MEKVIPRGLNYADLKPECIDCNIKIIKITPTATTHNAQQNDIIQFLIQGTGFLDPFSTYMKFTVSCNDVSNFPLPSASHLGMKVVDRSAHSFISRWVLRSNGVELERIENYDVCAAMLNDVMYSREQANIHYNEGFAAGEKPQGLSDIISWKPCIETFNVNTVSNDAAASVNMFIQNNNVAALGQIAINTAANAIVNNATPLTLGTGLSTTNRGVINGSLVNSFVPSSFCRVLGQQVGHLLETDTWCPVDPATAGVMPVASYFHNQTLAQYGNQFSNSMNSSFKFVPYLDYISLALNYCQGNRQASLIGEPVFISTHVTANNTAIPLNCTWLDYVHLIAILPPTVADGGLVSKVYDKIVNGAWLVKSNHFRIPCPIQTRTDFAKMFDPTASLDVLGNADAQGKSYASFFSRYFGDLLSNKGAISDGSSYNGVRSIKEMSFTIPLYSGLLGILMPDKKLLPLSILPLQLEITLNPHALFCISSDPVYHSNVNFNRNYLVKSIQIVGHMLTFEQEVHRSLETIIAANGLMMHFNTFYLTPTMVTNNDSLPAYAQINMAFKSIKSIHFVFYYSAYQNEKHCRKLHFVSHNITKLQLRNGIDLTPSEPIEGSMGCISTYGAFQNILHTGIDEKNQTSALYNNTQFYVEMLKSWNKMHDLYTDSLITPYSFSIESYPSTPIVRYIQMRSGYYDAANFPSTGIYNATINTAFPVLSLITLQANATLLCKVLCDEEELIGRCQYGLTLEGEELGQDKSIITGRKGSLPFDLNFEGRPAFTQKNGVFSYMNTFLFLDMILFVRPDLVVTVLGK